jgi:MFS family permease
MKGLITTYASWRWIFFLNIPLGLIAIGFALALVPNVRGGGRGPFEPDLTKPQAYLINTVRGRIVDEPEVIKPLQEKRIAGAALDVYWNEPYWNDPPFTPDPAVPEELRKLDNVILAPTTEA